MGEAKRRVQKCVFITFKEFTIALENFQKLKKRRHTSFNQFLAVGGGKQGIYPYNISGENYTPCRAAKIRLLLSTHYETLYEAYCIRRKLL